MSYCLNLTDNLKYHLNPTQPSDTTKALSDIILSLFIRLIQSNELKDIVSSLQNSEGRSISYLNLKSLISTIIAKEVYITEISNHLSMLMKERADEEIKSEKFTVTKKIIKNAFDLPLDKLKDISLYCDKEKDNQAERKKDKIVKEKEELKKEQFLNKKHSQNISLLDTDFNSLPDCTNEQINKSGNVMKHIDFNGNKDLESYQNPYKLELNMNKETKNMASLSNLSNINTKNLIVPLKLIEKSNENNIVMLEHSNKASDNLYKSKMPQVFLFDPITIEKYNLSLLKAKTEKT